MESLILEFAFHDRNCLHPFILCQHWDGDTFKSQYYKATICIVFTQIALALKKLVSNILVLDIQSISRDVRGSCVVVLIYKCIQT